MAKLLMEVDLVDVKTQKKQEAAADEGHAKPPLDGGGQAVHG